MAYCYAVTNKGRFGYLRDDILSGESGEATELHRGVRQAWRNTRAYELVFQVGKTIIGKVGYRTGRGFGFDKSAGVCGAVETIGESETPDVVKNRVLTEGKVLVLPPTYNIYATVIMSQM